MYANRDISIDIKFEKMLVKDKDYLPFASNQFCNSLYLFFLIFTIQALNQLYNYQNTSIIGG